MTIKVSAKSKTAYPLAQTPAQLLEQLVAWLTLERLIYALLLGIAGGVRLYHLGEKLLSPLEASQAWPAWLDAMGLTAPHAPVPVSPLLYTGQRFLFWLTGGGGDAWARLLPALAGVGLVALSWWLRPWLGRTAALILAALLAIDPWQTAFSRLGDGASLSLFLGMLALICLLHLLLPVGVEPGTDNRTWGRVLAVAAGLLAVSGPLAWGLLPVLALFSVVMVRRSGSAPVAGLNGDGGEQKRWLEAAGLAAATAFLAATGWLVQPAGLTYVSSSFTHWLSWITGSAEATYSLGWAFLRLLVDEPLALVFGLGGLAFLLVRLRRGSVVEGGHEQVRTPVQDDPRWLLFLLGWTAWGILFMLFPGRNPNSLALLSLPLLLTSALVVDQLVQYSVHRFDMGDGLLVVGGLGVLIVTTGLLTSVFSQDILAAGFNLQGLILYLVLPVLALFFTWWAGWRVTSQALGMLAVTLLFLFTVRSAWFLNMRNDLPRGADLLAVTTHQDIRLLVSDVRKLSAIRVGDDTEIPVQVQMAGSPDPVLGWNLRMMRGLQWVLSPQVAPDSRVAPLVITMLDEVERVSLPDHYIGSDYGLTRIWSPTDLQEFGARVRWIMYRQVKKPTPVRSIVLWAKEE
jgi:hypothetical protein